MFSSMNAILNLITVVLGLGNPQNFPPPLSFERERELFADMKQNNSSDARAQLIEHNLRLVSHLVRKYYASYPYPDELISIGSFGLIKAVDTFDCSNGARFATYAGKCIQNEILMFFRTQKKTSQEVSINETIDIDRDGNPLTYLDIICTEDTFAEDLDRKIFAAKLASAVNDILTERERQIITLRYGLSDRPPMTQRQIASMMKISRSYVSRIEKKAISLIKRAFTYPPSDI